MSTLFTAPRRLGLLAAAAAVSMVLVGLAPLADAAPAEAASSVPNVAKLSGKLSKQKLKWESCTKKADPRGEYSDTTECALVTVPRDWKNPENGKTWKFWVSYNKLNDAKNSRFKGIMLGNPGGPGGEGLFMAEHLATAMPDLAPYYNFVGFNPRGIDRQSQAKCSFSVDAGDKSPFAEAKAMGEACADNADVKTITTEQTTYDMDFIRYLLGQEKLNYFGYSYGSWLGTWYSNVFHSKAGLMSLDSSLDTTQATYQHSREFDPWASKRKQNLWFDPYAERSNSGKESPAADKENPQNAPPASTATEKEQERFLNEEKTSSSSTVRDTAESQLDAMKQLKTLGGAGYDESVEDESRVLTDMMTMIECNDGQFTQGEKYWQSWVNRAKKEVSKDEFGFNYYQYPTTQCLNWRTQNKMPVADPKTYPKTIVIQSELDSQTAWEHGSGAGLNLPNTRLIAVDNEGTHGLFPYGTEGVDRKVIDFYLKGALPKQNISVNQGKPRDGEDVTYEYWKPLNKKGKHVGELVSDPWQKAGTPTVVPVPIEGSEIARQGELNAAFRSWVSKNYGAEGLKLIS